MLSGYKYLNKLQMKKTTSLTVKEKVQETPVQFEGINIKELTERNRFINILLRQASNVNADRDITMLESNSITYTQKPNTCKECCLSCNVPPTYTINEIQQSSHIGIKNTGHLKIKL